MSNTAYDFLAERHDRLAGALDRNTDVAKLVQGLLEHLIDRCESRAIAPADIHLDPPEILRRGNEYLVSARIR